MGPPLPKQFILKSFFHGDRYHLWLKQFIKSFFVYGRAWLHPYPKNIFFFFFVLVDMGTPVTQNNCYKYFFFYAYEKKSIKVFSDGGGRSDRYT